MTTSSKRVSIRDIAERSQVSTATVSRYINQSGPVDATTAERVRRAIKETGYTPSIAARSLKSQKGRIVLLVVPDIENPFYSSMAKTVQGLLNARGYVMTLYDSNESAEELAAVTLANQMYASGLLLASINIGDEVIAALSASKLQVVGLNAFGEYPFDTVHVRGGMGTYLATKHLIGLGHEEIGYAGGTPDSVIGKSRRAGYERAMSEAGLPLRAECMRELGFSQSDGYEMGRYFSSLSLLPTAVCCANDQIALGLISAMHEADISIPGTVSITGMDDIPYARIANPSLTTVVNDSVAFSREGVRMLFERIDGEYDGPPREVVVRHELVIRASSAPPRDKA